MFLTLLLLASAWADAVLPQRKLTPQEAQADCLAFEITAMMETEGMVHFHVVISEKGAVLSDRPSGALYHVSEHGVAAFHPLESKKQDHFITYDFVVEKATLEDATVSFGFLNHGPTEVSFIYAPLFLFWKEKR